MARGRLPPEFELIARHFAPLAAAAPGALGLGDDAALVEVAPGRRLVVTSDAVVAGVHFLPDDPPDLVARKALRVNLSDLAAMGARPVGYLLVTAFSDQDEAWLAAFAGGLAADQAAFGIPLLGGDTVATPGPLTIVVTALGEVPEGRELRRSRARPGDLVLVTGTLGDGALGLKALRGELAMLTEADRAALVRRYNLPEPRLAFGRAVAEGGLAACGMDISDGLVADLGHVCARSGVGAEIELARLPVSPAAAAAVAADPALRPALYAGGDDYELLLTAPPERVPALVQAAAESGLHLTPIGRIVAGTGVHLKDEEGREIRVRSGGYSHF
ncbi:MAG: thiamine-phosphate kinase [Rhodospirillaceae bacterium]|nr:thiamine-phosphate kinase [Rhodospirillaceae bacterium]